MLLCTAVAAGDVVLAVAVLLLWLLLFFFCFLLLRVLPPCAWNDDLGVSVLFSWSGLLKHEQPIV
jgi:hypothetical protein